MAIIIARWKSYKSGEKLVNKLLSDGVDSKLFTIGAESQTDIKLAEDDIVVNFGIPASRLPEHHLILNRHCSITASKVRCLNIFRKNEIPCPDFVNPSDGNEQCMLARLDYKSRGSGITVCYPGADYPKADFYVRFIQSIAEYRVHVWLKKAILVLKKITDKAEEEEFPIRSARNGYIFVDVEEYPHGIEQLAIRAVSAVQNDFGGVDILVSNNNQFYVLEINSSPGMKNGSTLDVYARVLGDLYHAEIV